MPGALEEEILLVRPRVQEAQVRLLVGLVVMVALLPVSLGQVQSELVVVVAGQKKRDVLDRERGPRSELGRIIR